MFARHSMSDGVAGYDCNGKSNQHDAYLCMATAWPVFVHRSSATAEQGEAWQLVAAAWPRFARSCTAKEKPSLSMAARPEQCESKATESGEKRILVSAWLSTSQRLKAKAWRLCDSQRAATQRHRLSRRISDRQSKGKACQFKAQLVKALQWRGNPKHRWQCEGKATSERRIAIQCKGKACQPVATRSTSSQMRRQSKLV